MANANATINNFAGFGYAPLKARHDSRLAGSRAKFYKAAIAESVGAHVRRRALPVLRCPV